MSDLYSDLGLDPSATPEELKKAHRKKSRDHHPDTGDGNREKFDAVQRAAVVLCDPAKKEKYDQTGHADNEPDNEKAMIADLIGQVFMKVYNQHNIDYTDLIDKVRDELEAMEQLTKGQIASYEDAISKAEKGLKRLAWKGKASNLIGGLLKRIVSDNNRAKVQAQQRVDMINQAGSMLEDYEWEVDERPQPSYPWEMQAYQQEAYDALVRQVNEDRNKPFFPFNP